MNTATKKAIIINSDNKSYASFNAYQRPKRKKNNAFKKPANVRIVNLDPTDDPDQVCEAYRQIRIREQCRRIAKNEARLAEKRRIADEKAVQAAAKEAQREENIKTGVAKSIKTRRESRKSIAASQRQALISKILKAGKVVNLRASEIESGDKKITVKSFHIKNEVEKLRINGYDIVSIVSAGMSRGNAMSVSLFMIDDLKRPTERVNEIYAISQTDVMKAITEALKQGFVLTADDIRASKTAVKNAIYQLRFDGLPICVVKNRATDNQARGWILPCEANGLHEFIAK